jgi:hypothetical protein
VVAVHDFLPAPSTHAAVMRLSGDQSEVAYLSSSSKVDIFAQQFFTQESRSWLYHYPM